MASPAVHASLSSSLSLVARLLDVGAVLLGALLAYYWRFSHLELGTAYQLAMLIAAFSVLLVFPLAGSYRSSRGQGLFSLSATTLIAWGSTLLLLLVIAVLTQTNTLYSRLWFGAWAMGGLLLLLLFRLGLHRVLRLMRERHWNQKRIVIVGCGPTGIELAERLSADSGLGLEVIGFVRAGDESELAQLPAGQAMLGELDALAGLVERESIAEVWLALPLRAEERLREVMHQLRHSTVSIRYVPDIFGFRLLNHSVSEVAGMSVMDLSVSPMVGLNRLVKALEDRVLGLLIVILISPLLLLIALAVKFSSPGPVLFKQKRHGWDGKPITVYKFRSMQVHQEQAGTLTQASRNDPRITPLGAFLRRTSLDELPQFINVLQGRMSIVGPRPHAIAHNDMYKEQIDAYMLRHKVKPGISGWAQVNGWRGETDTVEKMEKRVEYDLYYIEHWSLWFDLKIILLTLTRGFINKNAY